MTPSRIAASDGRRLAVVRDYSDLVAALRSRAKQLGMTREALDHVAGLQSGYAAKLLAPVPIRRLGRSLGPMLRAMGVALVMVEDAESLKRIDSHIEAQNDSPDTSESIRASRRSKRGKALIGCSEWGRMMAARRSLIMTPKQLSEQCRNAVRARWAKAANKSGIPMAS